MTMKVFEPIEIKGMTLKSRIGVHNRGRKQ